MPSQPGGGGLVGNGRRPGRPSTVTSSGPVISRRADLRACGCLAGDEPQGRKKHSVHFMAGSSPHRSPVPSAAPRCCGFEPWHRWGHGRAADMADRDHRDLCAADPDNRGP